MIMREWRGRVLREKAADYIDVLESTGLADYANTPGNRGVFLLRKELGTETEFTTLTLWDSLESIRAFAGDDATLARYYPEDANFLLNFAERAEHYEVAAMK